MKFLLKILFLSLLVSLHLSALTLVNDTFDNGSKDGWGGDSYTYQNDGWLYFTPDGTASKTYNFGTTYANKSISFTFEAWVSNSWESSGSYKDYFNILVNNANIDTITNGGGYFTKTYSTTLNSSGAITISFNPNTTATNEYSGINYLIIK